MGPKHSRKGVASFVISLVVWFTLVPMMFGEIFGITKIQHFGAEHQQILFCWFIIGLILNPVCMGLGIAGMLDKDRKRVFAVLGVIFNYCLLIAILIAMGWPTMKG